eukprot:GILK01004180.1.p2 GENE.GILK01004180.1~~GILK01004180.1.p2  ORF type:complete len:315 (+),score=40.55 GILK01004180.1:36-947(+)
MSASWSVAHRRVLCRTFTRQAYPSPTIRRLDAKVGGRFYQVDGFATPFPSVTTILDVIDKPGLKYWIQAQMFSSIKNSLVQNLIHSDDEFSPQQQFLLMSKSAQMEWIDEILLQARNSPDNVKNTAADIGTRAHAQIDGMINAEIKNTLPNGEAARVDESAEIALCEQDITNVIKGFQNFRRDLYKHGMRFVSGDRMVYSGKYQFAGALDGLVEVTTTRHLIAVDFKTSNSIRPEYALQVAAYAKAFEEMHNTKVHEGWLVRFSKDSPTYQLKKVKNLDQSFTAFLSALMLWRCFKSDSSKLI